MGSISSSDISDTEEVPDLMIDEVRDISLVSSGSLSSPIKSIRNDNLYRPGSKYHTNKAKEIEKELKEEIKIKD